MYINGWNNANEIYCQSIGERASSLYWMHDQARSLYIKRTKFLSFLINFIATTVAVAKILEQFFESREIGVVNSVIGVILATIVKYYTNSKDNELAELHKKTSHSYSVLASNIQFQLAFPRKDRNDAKTFSTECQKIYDNLQAHPPNVPITIIDKFTKKYGADTFSKPIITGEINRIKITDNNNSNGMVDPVILNNTDEDPEIAWVREDIIHDYSDESGPSTLQVHSQGHHQGPAGFDDALDHHCVSEIKDRNTQIALARLEVHTHRVVVQNLHGLHFEQAILDLILLAFGGQIL